MKPPMATLPNEFRECEKDFDRIMRRALETRPEKATDKKPWQKIRAVRKGPADKKPATKR